MRLRRHRDGWLADVTLEPVLLELRDGRTIAGLAQPAGGSVTLRAARLLTGDGWTSLDGEIVVPREQVAWAQRGISLDDTAALERRALTREVV